jgi:bis(5'-nucleosyl)-tetraphosphatase (symmetrical)
VGNPVQRIFVGDVQGCADELEEVLERAARAFGDRFELWSVGDLINRGPDSLGVLRRVRGLIEAGRARMVLGNHEIGLLRSALGLRRPEPRDTFAEVLASPDADEWIRWLRERPLLETGTLGETRFAMLHAAVDPRWSLSELRRRARRVEARLSDPDLEQVRRFLATSPDADPDRCALDWLTRYRSVDASGRGFEAPPGEGRVAWHAAWSRARHSYAVVYGHWAMQGLHVAARLRGLDTGCVHHGRGIEGALTAWLPSPDDPAPFSDEDSRFWRIPARRSYGEGP